MWESAIPGSRHAEAAQLLSRVKSNIQQCDWLWCEGLLDALVAVIGQSGQQGISQSGESVVDQSHHRVTDVSYFDEPVPLSVTSQSLKQYLLDVASGKEEILGSAGSDHVKSQYHLQRLVLNKTRTLFPPTNEEEAEGYEKLHRQVYFRILLFNATQLHSLVDNFSAVVSKLFNEGDECKLGDEELTSCLEAMLLECQPHISLDILQTLLANQSDSLRTVELIQKCVLRVLEEWNSSSNHAAVLLLVNSLDAPLSDRLDLKDFFGKFYRDAVVTGAVKEEALYRAVLADKSHHLTSQLDRVIDLYYDQVYPSDSPELIHQSVHKICSLSDEAQMWKHMYFFSSKLNRNYLDLIMEMMVNLIQNELFEELKRVVDKDQFMAFKPILLLLGWKYVYTDFANAQTLLHILYYSEEEKAQYRSLGYAPVFKVNDTLRNQVDLIKWCNEKSRGGESVKQHPTVLFNGLDSFTPLYVLNNSTDLTDLDKDDVIKLLDNRLLYNNATESDTMAKTDIETYHAFHVIQLMSKALVSSCRGAPVDASSYESLTLSLIKEASSVLHDCIANPSLKLELSENIFSLLFVRFDQLKDSELKQLQRARMEVRNAQGIVSSSSEHPTHFDEESGMNSSGWHSSSSPQFSESGFMASIAFVRDTLNMLGRGLQQITPQLQPEAQARGKKFGAALSEAIQRFKFVTDLPVDKDNGKFLKDAQYLIGFPEKVDVKRGGRAVASDLTSCVAQMLSDPVALVFKCLWRKDFDLAKQVLSHYKLEGHKVASLVETEKGYQQLLDNVDAYGKRVGSGPPRRSRHRATALDDQDSSDSTRRPRGGGMLESLAAQAQSTLDAMTVPELVQTFIGSVSLPDLSKFVETTSGREQFNKFMCNDYEAAVNLDLAVSSTLPNDVTRDLVEAANDRTSRLELLELDKEKIEMTGFKQGVVSVKNLLFEDACEETSLVSFLSQTSLPLRASTFFKHSSVEQEQIRSREQMQKLLQNSLKENKQDLATSLTHSVDSGSYGSSSSPSRPKTGGGGGGSEKTLIHEGMKALLRAFAAPDITLRVLLDHVSSRGSEPELRGAVEGQPPPLPKRVFFLDVFYEYVKLFAKELTLFDKLLKKRGESWTLVGPDNRMIRVSRVADCPFLVLLLSPTEIVSDIIFNKSFPPDRLDQMCAKLGLNLSEIICNRLEVSLPWTCLSLQYNQESVMGCGERALNEFESGSEPDFWNSYSSPNLFVEKLLSKFIKFIDDHVSSKGILAAPDLLKICDNFDLWSMLEETRHLVDVDLGRVSSQDQKFAFFVNVHNLMILHAAVVEAKAIRQQKASMSLNCLLGGNPIERLALEWKVTYRIGQLGLINAWQLRHCVIRGGSPPPPDLYGLGLDCALSSLAQVNYPVVCKRGGKEEFFLLIDATYSSPVLQVVKPGDVQSQTKQAKQHLLENDTIIKKNSVQLPQLIDTFDGELSDVHLPKDARLRDNPDLARRFLLENLQDEKKEQVYNMRAANVSLGVRPHQYRFRVQYEFQLVADFAMFEEDIVENTSEHFVDGFSSSFLCERGDRHQSRTFPLSNDILAHLSKDSALLGCLVDLLNSATKHCRQLDQEKNPAAAVKSRSFSMIGGARSGSIMAGVNKKISTATNPVFGLDPSAASSNQPLVPAYVTGVPGKKTLSDICREKLGTNFVYSAWARYFLSVFPRDGCWQYLETVLAEHGLLSGSKCPKVVMRMMARLWELLAIPSGNEQAILVLVALLRQEAVNESRFQPLLDILYCTVSSHDPTKLFLIRDPLIRAAFVAENYKRFPLDKAQELLECVLKDDLQHESVLKKCSAQLKRVLLFNRIHSYFPPHTEEPAGAASTEETWTDLEKRFLKASYADIIHVVCDQKQDIKTADQWCQLAPVDNRVKDEVKWHRMKSLAEKENVFTCIAELETDTSLEFVFGACQSIMETASVDDVYTLATYLLDAWISGLDDEQEQLCKCQRLSAFILEDFPEETVKKYRDLINYPKLIIEQMLMNQDLKVLESVFEKLSSSDSAVVTAMPKGVSLEGLQNMLFPFAEHSVRLDRYLREDDDDEAMRVRKKSFRLASQLKRPGRALIHGMAQGAEMTGNLPENLLTAASNLGALASHAPGTLASAISSAPTSLVSAGKALGSGVVGGVTSVGGGVFSAVNSAGTGLVSAARGAQSGLSSAVNFQTGHQLQRQGSRDGGNLLQRQSSRMSMSLSRPGGGRSMSLLGDAGGDSPRPPGGRKISMISSPTAAPAADPGGGGDQSELDDVILVAKGDRDWMEDSGSAVCLVCRQRFTVTNRRHHCRHCGRLVHNKCLQDRRVRGQDVKVCLDCIQKFSSSSRTRQTTASRMRSPTVTRPQSHISIDVDELAMRREAMRLGPEDDEENRDYNSVIRAEFVYPSAPSVALLTSILDLYSAAAAGDPLQDGTWLIAQIKTLSIHIPTIIQARAGAEGAHDEEEAERVDPQSIISMLRAMLNLARVKLLNSDESSKYVDQCNRLLNRVDILSMLIALNCDDEPIPGLDELENDQFIQQQLVPKLLKLEFYRESLDVYSKCGMDERVVLKAWGIAAIKNGNFEEAREILKKCFDHEGNRPNRKSARNEELVNELVGIIETTLISAPVTAYDDVNDFIRQMEQELSGKEPLLTKAAKREECVFYISTYLHHSHLIKYFACRREIAQALALFNKEQVSVETFQSCVLGPLVLEGAIPDLLATMRDLDASMRSWRRYLMPSCTTQLAASLYSLENLYLMQLALQDFVRASETCCELYRTSGCTSYEQLLEVEPHLVNAKECLLKAQAAVRDNSRIDGNKQMSDANINWHTKRINLQLDLVQFLLSIDHLYFPETRSPSGERIGGPDCPVPTLLGGASAALNLAAAILLQCQTGAGFNLAISVLQLYDLKVEDVGEIVALELHRTSRLQSIVYLSTSFQQHQFTSSYNDAFLVRCVSLFVDNHHGEKPSAELSGLDNQIPAAPVRRQYPGEKPSAELRELHKLVDKISQPNLKIEAFLSMNELQHAYFVAVKKGKDGVKDHAHRQAVLQRLSRQNRTFRLPPLARQIRVFFPQHLI